MSYCHATYRELRFQVTFGAFAQVNKTFLGLLVVALIVAIPGAAFAEGISREQGDEILKELKQIRGLLQQQQLRPQKQRAAPAVQRGKVSVKGSPYLGKKSAPLTLVEFTDYQCPYCKRFYDATFAQLKKAYIDTGKLRFVSRNLPLPFHPFAEGAALAAACAGDQGKENYWKMREALFFHSPKLQPEQVRGYAKELGLSMKRFNTCLENKTHLKKIEQDMADARSVGITGTPSFLLARGSGDIVEGEKLVGAQPFAVFDERIKALLNADR